MVHVVWDRVVRAAGTRQTAAVLDNLAAEPLAALHELALPVAISTVHGAGATAVGAKLAVKAAARRLVVAVVEVAAAAVGRQTGALDGTLHPGHGCC